MSRHQVREPVVRVSERGEAVPFYKALLIRAIAIIAALVLCGGMVAAMGFSPLEVYKQIFVGSIGSAAVTIITLERTIPLIIATLAIILAFKMRFWNIGANGQIAMGATAAAFFAYQMADKMPQNALFLCMFVAGAAGGGLWGLIPALTKAKWNTNETLFTLMMNYIATYVIQFLRRGPWEDPMMPSFGQMPMFDAAARLPKLFGVSFGWVIAVILVAVVYIYLRQSKQGFEIAVVGASNSTARYAGMDVKKVFIRTMIISGALAGIAGMLKICGMDYKLNENIAGNIGFTGITIAWLAKLNPLTALVVAFLFSALSKGCESVSSSTALRVGGVTIPSASAMVIMGVILFAVLGCEFFIHYQLHFKKRQSGQAKEATA